MTFKVSPTAASTFIPRIKFPEYNIPMADFKGHQQKALRRLQQLAPQIDLLLEIRDARAPISTRNVLIDQAVQGIDKVILYSKRDFANLSKQTLERFNKWHTIQPPQYNQKSLFQNESSQKESYMFLDCRNKRDATYVIEIAKMKYNNMHPKPPLGLRLMIIGMPNVGKSTLVNTLRYIGDTDNTKKVARTGGMPGVTRSTSEILKINSSPSIYLYDTPGISLPKVKDPNTMIILALIGSINTRFVDPVIQADYLLYVMNLQEPTGKLYRQYLDHPTNNIFELLKAIAKKIGKDNFRDKYNHGRKTFDEIGTAIYWIDSWRQAKFKFKNDRDKIMLDVEGIDRYQNFINNTVDYQELKTLEDERVKPYVDTKLNNRTKSSFERKIEKQNSIFTHKRVSKE